jgi:hypothetical protein
MAERTIRSSALTTVIQRLVSHTSLKKAGRLRNASKRSFKVTLVFMVFLGGRAVFNIISSFV